jgi:hypothetical protein
LLLATALFDLCPRHHDLEPPRRGDVELLRRGSDGRFLVGRLDRAEVLEILTDN